MFSRCFKSKLITGYHLEKWINDLCHPLFCDLLFIGICNQTMGIKWGNYTSSCFTIRNGVRQGSVLSPQSFSCQFLLMNYVIFCQNQTQVILIIVVWIILSMLMWWFWTSFKYSKSVYIVFTPRKCILLFSKCILILPSWNDYTIQSI